MKQGSVLAALAGIVLLAALAIVFAGAFGTSRVETSAGSPVQGTFDGPPANGSYGIVVSTHRSKSPVELFGLKFGSSRWEASVAIVLPAGCQPAGDQVTATGPCREAAAVGKVSGGGTTAGGTGFVIVSTPVSEECHRALTPGERWPASYPECAH